MGTCADVGFGWLLNTGAVCGILRGAVPTEACLNSEVGVRKGLMFLLRFAKMPFDALRRIFRFSIIPLALFEALWGGGVTEFSCTAWARCLGVLP